MGRFNEEVAANTKWERLMVKFSLIHTSSYAPFVRNLNVVDRYCVSGIESTESASASSPSKHQTLALANNDNNNNNNNNNNNKLHPMRKILDWQPLVQMHLILCMLLYAFYVLKYKLLDLLEDDSLLERFRHLDCFILGRFKLIGRTNLLSRRLLVFIVVYFAIYRLIVSFYVPKFKFYACEFLFHDYDEVADIEERTRMSERETRLHHATGKEFTSLEEACGDGGAPVAYGDISDSIRSVYFLRNQFDPDEREWIPRLNRTCASWLTLKRTTRVSLFMLIGFAIAFVGFNWYMLVGSVLTNFGFELSYPNCAAWVRDRQFESAKINSSSPNNGGGSESSPRPYAYIFVAPKVLASEMRLEQLPVRVPLDFGQIQVDSIYNVMRVFADLVENTAVYLEFGTIFSAHFYLLTLHSMDILINVKKIKRRLDRIIAKLDLRLVEDIRRSNAPSSSQLGNRLSLITTTGLGLAGEPPLSATDVKPLSFELSRELTYMQAILLDHFKLTMAYNSYASFFFVFVFAGWLCYTIIVCVWMASEQSRGLELEFVLVEVGTSVLVVSLLTSAEIVRSRNANLYPLIARMMALDPFDSLSKPRWPTILMYFYPRSLYCLTLLDTSEISWLFSLKLISWVTSAFIVLASFFYSKQRR